MWGQGGWGRGEMALAESESVMRTEGLEQAGAYRTGNGLSMVAVGIRGALPSLGGFTLAVKSDVFLVRTASDAVAGRGSGNLASAEAGVSRVRAALEGSRELRFAVGHAVGRSSWGCGRTAATPSRGRVWRPASGWSMLTRTSG